MPTFYLSDEILYFLRRWHWLVGAMLLGALLGWAADRLLPARYEAIGPLSVHFNADAVYLTPDDYKNWQVAELSDLAESDAVLGQTLERLQAEFPEFSSWTAAALREIVEPRWRNAGSWDLVVQAADPDQARVLAEVWRDVLLEQSAVALQHAVAFNQLDRELNALARSEGEVQANLAVLNAVDREMRAWLLDPAAGGGVAGVAGFAARLQNWQDVSLALPSPTPDLTFTLEKAAAWVEATRAVVADEIAFQGDVLSELRATYDTLEVEWQQELAASRGLSAYLQVDMGDPSGVRVERVTGGGLLALVGGLLGLLVVPVFRLSRVVVRSGRDGN